MNSYDLLQRGIRKYIYDAGWESLRGHTRSFNKACS